MRQLDGEISRLAFVSFLQSKTASLKSKITLSLSVQSFCDLVRLDLIRLQVDALLVILLV